MAKGDIMGGTAQGGAVPQGGGGIGGQGGGNPNGASKSMNDILAMLSHLGIGAQNNPPVPFSNNTGGPQFGFNKPGAQGPMGMGQGNRNQLSGNSNMLQNIMQPLQGQGDVFQNMKGYLDQHNQQLKQNMMNPNAAFGGGEHRAPMNPGMGSILPTNPGGPLIGNRGGGIWQGPSQDAMNQWRLQGTTRSGSNIMRDGQAVGHYGNKNEPVFNQGGGYPGRIPEMWSATGGSLRNSTGQV